MSMPTGSTTPPAAEGIAIVGMAVRFPGADSVEAFWRNLRDGVESVTFFSDDELRAAGVEPATLADPRYVKANGVLRGADEFDAAFFGLTPREAEAMDPQHRVFLEVAWEALERAGYDSTRVAGRVGVFAGAGMSTYLVKNLAPNRAFVESAGELALLLGNNKDFVPTRASYKLDLRGPSVNVNTACSTSLVATHLACQSLLDFHCDMALAGGVAVQVPQVQGYFHSEGGIGSPDGHCRAFDAQARGTVSGNGVGLVVLKRLADALADGDTIHAVIRGSAVNNDGADKIGFTAPSVDGQSQVIAEAQAVAGVTPDEISYVEAHGTGTELGDPIEVAALTQVFGAGATRAAKCALGSVKTNFGHLDEAAGIAGLVKTVLALEHRELPPSLHFATPNPKIDFARTAFAVNARRTPWTSPAGVPRRAGVSSFGIGGTNAHVVLEEAPALTEAGDGRRAAGGEGARLLVLSAKTETALAKAMENLANALDGETAARNIGDVAYTLALGRRQFSQRCAVVARDAKDAAERLRTKPPRGAASDAPREVVFLFSGQGSQYSGMLAGLYASERVIREEVDRCAEILRPLLGLDLRTLLSVDAPDAAARLKRTALAQPALFVADYALAKLWLSWGVKPVALLGHSLGEYVAACLAGIFSLEDALALVAARGALMEAQPPGAMLAVGLPETEAAALARAAQVTIAAVNAPDACVLSGETAAIAKLEAELASRGVPAKRLETSHAFHSPLMEGALAPFAAKLRAVRFAAPKIPIVSNLTGRGLTAEEATSADYWVRHLREPVRFAEGVVLLRENPARVFLEVGPGRALASMVQRAAGRKEPAAIFTSTRHAEEKTDDVAHLLGTLGGMWTLGVSVDWAAVYAGQRRRRVVLPTYPFERQRYWIEAPRVAASTSTAAPEAKAAVDISTWFYVPAWQRVPATTATAVRALRGERILAFVGEDATGAAIVAGLERAGAEVSAVRSGREFAAHGARGFTVVAESAADYGRLLQALGSAPRRIVHAWSVSEIEDDRMRALGFQSLICLAQALGSMGAEAEVTVVSSGLWGLEEGDAVQAEKALLVGPVRSIPLEYPAIACRSVDVRVRDTDWAAQLVAEVSAPSPGPFVAWRKGGRFVQKLRSQPLPAADARAAGWREKGCYAITGGLGSMGLAFARELATQARARLLLIGRTPPTPAQQRAIAELEQLGAEVMVVTADVADGAQLKAVFARAREKFGAIHGAIHTAGVLGQGLIHDATPTRAATTLAAKVAGTRALAAALENERLDFLLLCSSLAAFTPVLGQVEYCAANAFLDAFAVEHGRRTGTRTIAIDWGVWQELGMIERATLPEAAKQAVRDEIAREGWHDVGVQALRRIAAHARAPQIVVSPQPVRLPRTPVHPWLTERIEEAEHVAYAGRLSASEHWVVSEHRIEGQAILPGTGYLELVRGAWAEENGPGPVELRDVSFLCPLLFAGDETKEVRVLLKGGAFHVVSRAGDETWIEHARGEIVPGSPAAMSREAKTAALQPAALPAHAVQFGPRWHNVRAFAFADDRSGVAELALADEFVGDADALALHPALLDMATGFITVRHPLPDSLPFSYRRIALHGALPARFRSRVQIVGRTETTLDLDAVLRDATGAAVVEIEGYRLKRMPPSAPASANTADNARLMLGAQGALDSLALAPATRRAPRAGEVEIQVEAAGLNFIEVLYALGLLPAAPGLEASFGLECAGRIVRVGEGVSEFRAGDPVFAYAAGSFAGFVTAPVATVAKRPPGMSAAEAATLPAALATAHFALVTQGRLARGERVLIHAAAGGVGLAAVQIAQRIGAEIFATAGSEEKRRFLRELGVRQVMDSRSVAFAEEIMMSTHGRGVDVVLNSLSGEFLAKGLDVLAPHGRFLELGKRDLIQGAKLDLRPFAKIISFIVVDVSPEMPGIAGVWREVAARIAAGDYRPLPHRAFALTDASAAFAHMARAKHIGKVVLTVGDTAALLRAAQAYKPAGRGGLSLAAILGEAEPMQAKASGASPSVVAPVAAHERPTLATAYVAPADDIERAIAGVWQELLGVARVGANDNFFELRGDSLLAAQVMARLQTAVQAKLPLSALFDAPTVAGLAARVRTARSAAQRLQAVPAGAHTGDEEEGEL